MKKYRFILGFILIFLLLSACEKSSITDESEKTVIDSLPPLDSIPAADTAYADTAAADTCYTCELSDTATQIYNSLLEAYNGHCIACLEQVLMNWENKFNENTYIIDSLQDVYDVYKEFYQPWALDMISDSEFGHDIYKGISYYIIQSHIYYDYYFRTYGNGGVTIDDFRPAISNDTISLLYLNADYESAINCFLGSDYAPFGSGNVMRPAFAIGESYKRYQFLNNFLKFFHGHWGNYWHLETHPEVLSISFNTSKDSAQVKFRLGYQGGEVILGKKENSWKIIDHYMTWIE